ncbi:MAG: sigma-70 family RNA polymerase sigma factor [Verrucomicrobiales bacterium]|nr:sigma-70 family RNA polymerase sigma factor [Verrucomicrobiales bacterium]
MNPVPTYKPETTMEFTELMVSHQSRLLAYIRCLVANPDVAKDVLQQTNLILLKKSKDFQLGSSFSAWARRVAYFEVLTQRRTMGRERILFDGDLLEKMASTVERRSDQFEDRREALAQCMKSLPEKSRVMLVERYVDQKGVASIAKETGANANAVSQQLFRIKANLMKCVLQRLQALEF